MQSTNIRALTAALLSLSASLAFGDELPDNTFRIGAYAVFFHTSVSPLAGPFIPPGEDLTATVKNVQTPYFAYLRKLSTHFTFELAFGVPPLTKAYGTGPATLAGTVPFNGQQLLSSRWVAPTGLLEYVFFDESYALRPYVGVGVNYSMFYDRNITPAGQAIIGGPTRVELSSSVGPAVTGGFTYRLPKNWSVMASYSWARVTSHLNAITTDVVRTSSISFGPTTFVAAVGYSF
jgi:outer membrane protein